MPRGPVFWLPGSNLPGVVQEHAAANLSTQGAACENVNHGLQATLVLVTDCPTGELLGWRLSRTSEATTTSGAVARDPDCLILHFGQLLAPFLLRTDNRLGSPGVATRRWLRSCGPFQEFITPLCSQQNGMVERVIRTLKEQWATDTDLNRCSIQAASLATWISFYNHRRSHQALSMKAPAEAFALVT